MCNTHTHEQPVVLAPVFIFFLLKRQTEWHQGTAIPSRIKTRYKAMLSCSHFKTSSTGGERCVWCPPFLTCWVYCKRLSCVPLPQLPVPVRNQSSCALITLYAPPHKGFFVNARANHNHEPRMACGVDDPITAAAAVLHFASAVLSPGFVSVSVSVSGS